MRVSGEGDPSRCRAFRGASSSATWVPGGAAPLAFHRAGGRSLSPPLGEFCPYRSVRLGGVLRQTPPSSAHAQPQLLEAILGRDPAHLHGCPAALLLAGQYVNAGQDRTLLAGDRQVGLEERRIPPMRPSIPCRRSQWLEGQLTHARRPLFGLS